MFISVGRNQKACVLMVGFVALVGSSILGGSARAEQAEGRWVVVLHGGAGSTARKTEPAERAAMDKSLRAAIGVGRDVLSNGGTALEAVEKVVVALENDPRFNAGRGAVFTREGTHELDASIMDGATLRCGGVGGVKTLKNPVVAARLVMEHTQHVFLAGERADAFGKQHACEQVSQDYYYTDRRFEQLNLWLAAEGHPPITKPGYPLKRAAARATNVRGDSRPLKKSTGGVMAWMPCQNSDLSRCLASREELGSELGEVEKRLDGVFQQADSGGHGTVGCVALDRHGNLAAATSTGGRTGKMPGRIGDSPIIGAGNYANNGSCAVSGTGKGEEFIRHSICARMGILMESRGLTLDEAAKECVFKVLKPEDGGLIAVDRQGNVAMVANTNAMPRAMADSSGRVETAIEIER
ncbi:MAG: isoaspartyl peptidase/L-asparaginase [Pirellulales bacterium]|nr:isoaspartyl peptidase/L-asparaginase [Pirellulales bacterium]